MQRPHLAVSLAAYAGSQKSPSLISLVRAILGKETSPGAQMTFRERVDFSIIALVFSVLVAACVQSC
jgi:FLVCR family MFS transporter 7